MLSIPRTGTRARVGRLEARMGGVTDPAQQARMQTRSNFLRNQAGMGPANPVGAAPLAAPATPMIPTSGGSGMTAPPPMPDGSQGRAFTGLGRNGYGQGNHGSHMNGQPLAPVPGANGQTFTGFGRNGYGQGKHGSQVYSGAAPGTPGAAGAAASDVTTLPGAVAPTPTPLNPSATTYPGAMRSIDDFLPKDVTGGALYNWQLDQGNRALNQRLAANGLLGSGKDIRSHSDLASQLAATEANRLQGVADTEASRYDNYASNEALRLERGGESQWRRLMDVVNTMTEQNPLQYGYNAATGTADGLVNRGRRRNALVSDMYGRPSIGAGAGMGGGASAGPFIPPYASSPDFSSIDMIGPIQGQDFGSNLLHGVGNMISGFFA